jgi:hypothetical protein
MRIYEKFANNGRISFFILLVLIIQQLWIIIKGIAIDYFNPIVYTFLTRVFFSYIFYFILGIYVCQNNKYVLDQTFDAKKWILPTIIIFTVVISAFWISGILKYGSYYSIPQSYFLVPALLESIYYPFVFSILFILIFSIIKNNYSRTILLIGRYSFGIYLIHALYIDIIATLIFPQIGVDFNHLIFYPVLFVSSLLLSYFSVHLISYSPYGEVIMGTTHNN